MHWQLGAVRWMRAGSREVEFGIEFPGPLAMPATALAAPGSAAGSEGGERLPGFPAIWLPESRSLNRPDAVVLPGGSGPLPAPPQDVVCGPGAVTGSPAGQGREDRRL